MPMDAFPHVSYAAKSDIGRKRKNNEDSFGVFPSLGIFCVADGMGGRGRWRSRLGGNGTGR